MNGGGVGGAWSCGFQAESLEMVLWLHHAGREYAPSLANHSSAFSVQVWSPSRDTRLFLSEGSVHLSRQFLEKLTDSAIIKVAPRGDLSEVATGSRWLAAHPAVAEGVAAGAEPEVRIHLPPAESQANFRPRWLG